MKGGTEVQEVAIGAVGKNAGTDGNRLHKLEDGQVGEGHVAPKGEADLPSVAVQGPEGDVEEGRVRVRVSVALECDPEQAVLHLACQVGGWDCEFQQHKWGASGVFLEAEADSAFPVPEEGSGDRG